MQWDELVDQPCSVARTLSVIGDRWTLLILRDCFMKVRRFDDFHARLGIGRPILADRLQKLVDNFVLTKMAYQTNPLRYEYRLTQKGVELHPVIMSIVHWGDMHMAGKKGRPVLHQHTTCGHHFDPVLTCSACGEAVTAREVVIEAGPGAEPGAQASRKAAGKAVAKAATAASSAAGAVPARKPRKTAGKTAG
jgi:DNA-binding HxlR family transcriptional regulator